MTTRAAGRLGGIVAAVLLMLVPMSVLANGWAIVASPDAVGSITGDELSATTCASATQCWAVGQYLVGTGTEQTLIEEWDGASWTTVGSPDINDGGTQSNSLSAAACATSTECWAVGQHDSGTEQTLIEEWNGGSWVVVDSPSTNATQTNSLNSVFCETSTLCWAVGEYHSNTGAYQTLVEQWDGTSWAIVASPNTGPSHDDSLNAVTCASSTECWAVGGDGGAQQPLIEEWTGTSWTVVSSPHVGSSINNTLFGVTCASTTDCWAVGSYGAGANGLNTLAEQWNGASWTVISTPNPSTTYSNHLGSVTCFALTECWAVGSYNTSGGSSTLVEEWTGAAWTIVSAPDAADSNSLYGVTCLSATGCWAVGASSVAGTGSDQTLIERWDGSAWVVMTSPNNTGTTIADNQLADVSCASASECWVVGGSNGLGQSIIETWKGDSWQIAASPAGNDAELYGVTCAALADCWAVGSYVDLATTSRQTLIESWDGGAWAAVSSPNTSASQSNVLNSVTCTSSTECFAVGYYRSATNVAQTLIEQWDGHTWTIVASTNNNASQDNVLDKVACASASECWAVGSDGQTLIEALSGGAWTTVASPDIGTGTNGLSGVTCASSTECWAVGSYAIPAGCCTQTLIEKWDGMSWAVVGSPNETFSDGNAEPNALSGVTCTSTSTCWAVGSDDPLYGQTLVEQWSGASWTIVSSPDTQGPGNSGLSAATCVSPSECWASGTSSAGDGPEQTLIEEWRGSQLPGVTSVAPAAGPAVGGQTVSVSGTGFVAGMSVTLGDTTVTPTHVTATSFQFTTPAGAAGLTYLNVTVAIGTSADTAAAGYVYTPLASYFPLTPFRILDTRSASCIQCVGGKLGPSGTRTVQITGVSDLAGGADLVPATATAVVLNVTAVNDSSSSLLTVYPTGTGQPRASNLNFAPHTASANLVIVALGQNGTSDSDREINIFNAVGSVDVVADVQGYFAPQSAASPIGEFHPIVPLRVCDTRAHLAANPCNGSGGNVSDSTIGAGGLRKVNLAAVTGLGGSIPGDGTAEAAVLNLTAVSGSAATYLSVFPTDGQGHCTIPGGGTAPHFSTLNVSAHIALANRVMVPMGPDSLGANDSDVCVYNALGNINIVIDANGWYGGATAPTGKQYQAIGSSRICDTRAGSGTLCAGHTLTAGGVDTIAVAGVGGVPSTGAVAVIANLTAVGGTAATLFTLYPANLAKAPLASDLNVGADTALPNLAVVQLDTTSDSTAGDVKIYNGLGNVNAVIDVEGWFQ
jgi:hypothetical protein